MAEQKYCDKCKRTMGDTNFYTLKDGNKSDMCKACETMHINNWEPETYVWLLQKYDVPYIPAEWDVLRDRAYQKDPYKMNGMSVFGKYLSKMKLKQWKMYSYADTERLQLEAEEKAIASGCGDNVGALAAKQQEMKRAFENGEITEAQYLTYTEVTKPEPRMEKPGQPSPFPAASPYEQVELVDVGADLTDDDKLYLAMKWGRLYSPSEWVSLEELFTQFMESFDIQGAARLDTLKMICKTSLKMNQAIDCGDIDSYQKLSRVYDQMMKSAKFTEAQNKDQANAEFSSIGELVAFCEKEGGFIPRYNLDVDLDIVDKVVRDLKNYNMNLIKEDPTISAQIEQYIRKKEINDEMEKLEEEKEHNENFELEDKDVQDFIEDIRSQQEYDSTAEV